MRTFDLQPHGRDITFNEFSGKHFLPFSDETIFTIVGRIHSETHGFEYLCVDDSPGNIYAVKDIRPEWLEKAKRRGLT